MASPGSAAATMAFPLASRGLAFSAHCADIMAGSSRNPVSERREWRRTCELETGADGRQYERCKELERVLRVLGGR
jgi:hypothetical protein